MFFSFFSERKFRMVFKVVKGKRINYLSGTAHFFPYSFKKSLEKIVSLANRVIFEGPLDEKNMERVRICGQNKSSPSIFLVRMLDKEAKKILSGEFEMPVLGKDTVVFNMLTALSGKKEDILEREIKDLTPWMAFFKIWSFYLKKRGWIYSVDMEAHSVAKKMNKEIYYLETIEEQICALDEIPIERIVNFLNECSRWEKYAKKYATLYLKGDLEGLLRSTTSFPTRCPSIIEKRDPLLFERLLPFFEEGDAAAFIGITHIEGVSKRLKGEGYSISQGL